MEKTDKNNKEKSNMWGGVCVVACVVFIVLFVIFLSKGEVTTSGEYPGDVETASVICENEGMDYPIFQYDNSKKKEMKISAIFSNEGMESISLVHTLYYNNLNESIGSEAHNHAAMNIQYGEDGLGADAFSATYSKSETRMQMTIFAKKSDFDKTTAYKYFFLDHELPDTVDELMEILQNKGFACSISE